MNRISSFAVSFACLASTAAPLFAEDAGSYVAAAFQSQQASFPRKVTLTYKLGQLSFFTETTQESSVRLRLKTKANGAEKEFIMIDRKVYAKSGEHWTISKAPFDLPVNSLPAAEMARFISSLAEQSEEILGGKRVRVFAGRARWSGAKSDGTWSVAIDPEKKLPMRVLFSGRCEEVNCSMTQLFAYDQRFRVTQP